MIDRFEEILRELGVEYSLSLHPDKRGFCKLLMNDFHVQIECIAEQHTLLMATFIHELAPGKFRENILKMALKVNHAFPEEALLAYSEKNTQLTLFESIPLPSLSGKILSQHLALFLKKAQQWRIAIDTGSLTHLLASVPRESSGMLGL